MATESLEQTIKDLKRRIERMEAARICENMMSIYEYYHVNEQHKDVMAMYSKRPDTRVYFGEMGYWEGSDAPQKAWGMLDRMDPQPGSMHFHPTMCPIVEVAEDGQTAKGVWTTFGFETGADRQTGELKSQYAWGTYGVDFIKEDGEWKFWHFHIYRLLTHEEGKPWTKLENWNPFPQREGTPDERIQSRLPEDQRPNGPPVDDYPYQIDKVIVVKPDPPMPYKTMSDVEWS